MSTPPLTPRLKTAVLTHLNVPEAPPSLALLEQLIDAYVRTVPWESAFRIVRRANVSDLAQRPRWPQQFWQEHMRLGAGGTCFESNYAFFSLLRSLGFVGYLTINNMGESIGCHTAIVVRLKGQKWLADVGLPLLAPLPISPHGVMHRATWFHHYAVRPIGERRYDIERNLHPKPIAFTLIDKPISDAAYRAATTADYGLNGLFLDRIIINRVIDGRHWRFNMAERPWRLNWFADGQRFDVALEGDPATAVAHHFGLDPATVQQAFALTGSLH